MLATFTELSSLPVDWALLPVRGKRPYQKGWSKAPVCGRLQILKQIESGKATGYGLRLGISGYLAIDVDGESALDLLKQLAADNGIEAFEQTVAWTSDRSGRAQFLFRVPQEDWARCRNLRITTGLVGDDGKEEGLEFRWAGSQSVLPPSIHPVTEKPYRWINSPFKGAVETAPAWLIDLCANWRPESAGADLPDLIRFPARLFPHFGRQLSIWLLARKFDDSKFVPGNCNGENKGCGHGSFTLLAASRCLDRSKGHVRRLLCEAKKSGLIRNYIQRGDKVKVFYTSFEKVVAIAGISSSLGPVAIIHGDDLPHLHIIATEVEAQQQQKLSLYCSRRSEREQLEQEGKDPNKYQTRLIRPETLLTCENMARVKMKGSRYLYCEPDFLFYGGSQSAIAKNRGVSEKTISRHLSNSYRLQPAPLRGYREGLAPLIKRQLAMQLPHFRHLDKEGVWGEVFRQEGIFWGYQDWWKPMCNIYALNYRLVSVKRRRQRCQR